MHSGQSNRAAYDILTTLIYIHSNFQVLVDEASHIHDKIPGVMSRLESVKR